MAFVFARLNRGWGNLPAAAASAAAPASGETATATAGRGSRRLGRRAYRAAQAAGHACCRVAEVVAVPGAVVPGRLIRSATPPTQTCERFGEPIRPTWLPSPRK